MGGSFIIVRERSHKYEKARKGMNHAGSGWNEKHWCELEVFNIETVYANVYIQVYTHTHISYFCLLKRHRSSDILLGESPSSAQN